MNAALPDRVVFDDPLGCAFLYMAREEGLIEDRPEITDNWLGSQTREVPSKELRHRVLTQIVLTPKVVWPNWLPTDGVQGQLVDEQTLLRPSSTRTSSSKVQQMSKAWIVEMLASRGRHFSVSDIERLTENVLQRERECRRIEDVHGVQMPDKLRRVIREFVAHGNSSQVDWKPFTHEDIQHRVMFEEALHDWQPVLSCINTFSRTISVAEESGALVSVPMRMSQGHKEVAEFASIDARERGNHAMLAVVSEELGRIPFRPTLKETLLLARQPATVALREQLGLWKFALESADDSQVPGAEIMQVRREVGSALRGLQRAASFNEIGRWMTLISVPIGGLGFFLSGLPGTLPGFAVSAVGAIAQERSRGIQQTYRWAMFGNQ